MTCECDRQRRQIADMQDKLQSDQPSRAKYHKRYHTDEITQQNMATLSNPSLVMAEPEAIHAHPSDR